MVILAPSCNLDVYINYCYNQLTYTLLEVCVCAHACVAMCVLFYFCVFLPWLAHLAHWSLCVSLYGALFLSLSLSLQPVTSIKEKKITIKKESNVSLFICEVFVWRQHWC